MRARRAPRDACPGRAAARPSAPRRGRRARAASPRGRALAWLLLLACSSRDETQLRSPGAQAPPASAPPSAGAPPAATSPEPPATSPAPPSTTPEPPPVSSEPGGGTTRPPAQASAGPTSDGPDEPAPADAASAPGGLAEGLGPRAGLEPFERRCGPGGLTASGATTLARLPYLQRLGHGSVDILYKRARAGAPDEVEVSLPDGEVVARLPADADPGAADGLQRLARVQGLAPGTYHCYALAGLTERIGFRTAPLPDADASVRFAVFGDSGDATVRQSAVRDRLASIPVDLVLHTGDIAYDSGTLTQFEQRFFRVYEALLKSVPFFPVPGNHEYYTPGAAPFLEVFALPENGGDAGRERWFSFDFGDVHFVGLDTEQLGAEQTAWLERDLAANTRRWTIAYLHRPPFSSGYHGNAADVEQAFVPTLQEHGVPLVFAGHEHSYERTRPLGGVTYVITGGGGKALRAVGQSDFTAYSQSALHVTLVEVRGGTLQLSVIDVSGAVIDALELTR